MPDAIAKVKLTKRELYRAFREYWVDNWPDPHEANWRRGTIEKQADDMLNEYIARQRVGLGHGDKVYLVWANTADGRVDLGTYTDEDWAKEAATSFGLTLGVDRVKITTLTLEEK